MAILIQNTQFVAFNGFNKIFTSNVAVSLTNTLTETTVLSFTIPANTMLANSCLDMDFLFQTTQSNYFRVFRVYIGGTIIATFLVQNTASAAHRRILRNRNSQTSQVALNSTSLTPDSSGNIAGAPTVSAIDFTIDQLLTMSIQLTLATDTATINAATFLVY